MTMAPSPLALFEFFLFFAWIMCLFWVFGDIFRSRDLGGVAKTLWVLFVIFVPALGVLVYPDRPGRRHDRTLLGTAEKGNCRPHRPEVHQGRRRVRVVGRRADRVGEVTSRCRAPSLRTEFDAMKAKALA